MVTLSYVEAVLLPSIHKIQRAAGVDRKRLEREVADEEGYTKTFECGRFDLSIEFKYGFYGFGGGEENFRTKIMVYFLSTGKVLCDVVCLRRADIRKKVWNVRFQTHNDPNMPSWRLAKKLEMPIDVDITVNEGRAMGILGHVRALIRDPSIFHDL